MTARAMRGAVFLDRDGILNVDNGYVFRPADFNWIPGAMQAIRQIHAAGLLAVVVTNQSGIARGYFSEAEFLALQEWIDGQLAAQGERLDGVYYCPHHPEGADARYTKICDCRKPKPGLIQRAFIDLAIDRGGSFLIGDKERDVAAAQAAGIPGFRFEGGSLDLFLQPLLRQFSVSAE